jgi:peptidoglycan/LPS O-acetylase OafA/YrhL
MSLFFTLSGFVIAYNYLAMDWANRAAASAGRFAWLRFSRLYPVLLVYLALIYARPSDYGDQTLTVQSLLLLSVESLYPFKINGHWLTEPLCWSISTELALYAMFAGCVIAFRKAKLRFGRPASWVAVGVAILYLVTIVWLVWHPQTMDPVVAVLPAAFDTVQPSEGAYWFFYWSPYARFYDFAFGCIAAFSVIRGYRLPTWLAWAGPLAFGALWLAWVSGIHDLNPMFFQPLSPRSSPPLWPRLPGLGPSERFQLLRCYFSVKSPIRFIYFIRLPPVWWTTRVVRHFPGWDLGSSAARSRLIS